MLLPRLAWLAVAADLTHVSWAQITSRKTRPDTFGLPKAGVRWRHWIQDAYIEPGVLESDVREMASVGSEGFELLSYQSYGERGPTLEDPTVYSYGSNLWAQTATQYATQARENGLVMDWAFGPNQAAGVPYQPSEVDNVGFNTELVKGTLSLTPGTKWNGSLPAPELVTLTGYDGNIYNIAPITKRKLEGVVAIRTSNGNTTGSTVQLDYDTLQDLTASCADVTGCTTNITAAAGTNTLVIAFYSRRNGYPEAVSGFNGSQPGLAGSYGSFVHDHFSIEGAQKAIASNQEWVLPSLLPALNADDTGFSMWTDSNEFRAQLYWTEDLAARFQQDHNYSLALALPVLFGGVRPFSGANTPKQVYDYGNYQSERFRNDYKQTLTNLYLEYGTTLTEYARSINLTYSDQPAYNFQLDVGAAATVADVPESESLGQPSIDLLRQFTGGVNIAGRNIFSSELGAGRNIAYESTMIQQIEDSRMAFAGGVNQIIFHGFPSSTNYVQTSWPGLTPFIYQFSEMHGPRQPAWRHYSQYMEMLSREMWLLRKGVPKIDVAILRYGWDLAFNASNKAQKNYVFSTDDLSRQGYSYEYVSSYALGLDAATVQNGRLSPSGPSYKALVLNKQANLTVQAADQVLRVAQAGLPVVILGPVPSDIPGYDRDGSGKASVVSAMVQLTALSNVKQVDQEAQVPQALASLNATPSADIYSGIIGYPPLVRRRTDDDGTELYFVYNQGSSSTFSVGLEGCAGNQSSVFSLNSKTGEVAATPLWQQVTADAAGRVNVTFSLATNQSALFAVTSSNTYQNVTAPSVSVASVAAGLTPAISDGTLSLQSFASGSYSYDLSNGTTGTASLDLCGTASQNLTNWNLTLERWTPTSNLSSVSTVLSNSTFQLTSLVPWDQLDGQYNTSGVGTYTTTFTWSRACNGSGSVGAELRQPYIQHTQRNWLNGQELPVIDPVDPRLDISSYLVAGTNELVMQAASPLLNALNALDDNKIESVGNTRAKTIATSGGAIKRDHGKYGIMGVEIVPKAILEVAL